MALDETNDDAADVIALRALAWLLGEARRCDRFQALTGLDRETIRARAGEPDLLAAVLRHLAGHEPDLVACAEATGTQPAAMIDALERLENRCARF